MIPSTLRDLSCIEESAELLRIAFELEYTVFSSLSYNPNDARKADYDPISGLLMTAAEQCKILSQKLITEVTKNGASPAPDTEHA